MNIHLTQQGQIRTGPVSFNHQKDGRIDKGLDQELKAVLGDQVILGIDDVALTTAESQVKSGDFEALTQAGWKVGEEKRSTVSASYGRDGNNFRQSVERTITRAEGDLAGALGDEPASESKAYQKMSLTVPLALLEWDDKNGTSDSAPEGLASKNPDKRSFLVMDTWLRSEDTTVSVGINGRLGDSEFRGTESVSATTPDFSFRADDTNYNICL